MMMQCMGIAIRKQFVINLESIFCILTCPCFAWFEVFYYISFERISSSRSNIQLYRILYLFFNFILDYDFFQHQISDILCMHVLREHR